MFKKSVLLLLGVGLLFTLQAQTNRCGMDAYTAYKIGQDPKYMERMQEADATIEQWLVDHANDPAFKSGGTLTIPVVVHVVWKTASQNISDAQVMSQIDILNEDFNRLNSDTSDTPDPFKEVAGSMNIEFCLAQRDPNDEPTNGIERRETTVTTFGLDDGMKFYVEGGLDQWDPNRYFNIWVCNITGGILGYGEFPTGTTSDTYGLVNDYLYFGDIGTATFPYNLGRTAVHEVGHCLNLRHIWGDDGSSCGGSDLVDDTPNQGSEYYGCPSYPKYDACTPGDNGVMFMNYMDYTDDACMNLFTEGQVDRMWAALENFYPELLESNACEPIELLAVDAGVTEVTSPVGLDCDGTVSANATIRNWGVETLTSVTIHYNVVGGTEYSYNWSGSLASLATTSVTLPDFTIGDGTYDLDVYTSNPNGTADLNADNDSSATFFSVFTSGAVAPIEEGFEGADFPPAGWSISNGGGSISWALNTDVASSGDASAWMDNFNYNASGTEDELLAIPLNLTGMAMPVVTFDVAYAYFKQGIVSRTDALEILVTTNCGDSYTSLYLKEGEDLDTRSPTSFAFTEPTSSQWRTDTVDLSAFAGEEYVSVVFRNINGYGNNMFLDNINIFDNNIQDGIVQSLSQLARIYPNPADDQLVVEWNNAGIEGSLTMMNMSGQIVGTITAQANGQQTWTWDTSLLPDGMYTLLFTMADGRMATERILIQH